MTAVLSRPYAAPVLDPSPVKRAFASLTSAFKSWSVARERARRDAEYWVLAQTDHRVMAELRRAMCSPDVDPR